MCTVFAHPRYHPLRAMPPPHRSPYLVGLVLAAAFVASSVALYWLLGSESTPNAADSTVTSTAATATTFAGTTSATTGQDPTTTATTAPTTTVSATTSTPDVTTSSTEAATTTQPPAPLHPWVDRRTVGKPWGQVEGLLMFRGNPTNTWYGTGPVPETPEIKWRYPDAPMCSRSTDLGVTSTWCGNGWTGQPVLWVRPDGVTEMIFGAYDRRLHFVDAKTGKDTRGSLLTGDIIKGTPTIDPDGFPLVYFGSRDNKMRILALDRGEVVELWNVAANLSIEGRWNDDWDANPRIVNDIMFEGSENSIFYIYKLNRGYDDDGRVTVDPELLFKMPTWTDELMSRIGPGYPAVSVENSAALFEGRVYFGNSGGRILGLDITEAESGNVPIVFDYWVGDDVDASIIVDDEGMIYVSAEYERYLDRARSLGQLIKLNPYNPDDPYVWGMFSLVDPPLKGGLWSTPALGDGVLYAVTHKGFLVVVDQETGEELWVDQVGAGSWSSPAVIDDRLVLATNGGTLRSYSITDPAKPVLQWELPVGNAVIEATPAVWDGMIYIGSRDGFMYAIGE